MHSLQALYNIVVSCFSPPTISSNDYT